MEHNIVGLYEPIVDPRKRAIGIDNHSFYRYANDIDSLYHYFDIVHWLAGSLTCIPWSVMLRIFRPMKYTLPFDMLDSFQDKFESNFPRGFVPQCDAHVGRLASLLSALLVAEDCWPTLNIYGVMEEYELYKAKEGHV